MMVTEAKKKKNLKLGNWQVFVLDKLHQLYVKGTLCDVTLKFSDNITIQAHRLVLMACTTFFDHIPSSPSGVVLQMPKTMKAQYVKPIINFMYSGKLEFMSEDQNHIFLAAKQLGMNVLTELLQVQVTSTPNAKKPELKESTKKIVPRSVTKMVPPKVTPPCQNSASAISPHPPPPAVECTPGLTLQGKRLPIWKKRTTVQLPHEFYNSVDKKPSPLPVVELPRPTRFDWPDDESLPDIIMSQGSVDSFQTLSYDSKIMVKPVYDPKPVVLGDSIEMMPISTSVIQHGVKRARVSEVVKVHVEDDDYEDSHCDSFQDHEDNFESDVSTLSIEKSNVTTPKPILKNHEVSSPTPTKKVRFSLSSDKQSNAGDDLQQEDSPLAVPLQPLLDSPTAQPTTAQPPVAQPPTAQPPVTQPPVAQPPVAQPPVAQHSIAQPSIVPVTGSVGSATAPVNHAKIINEILKKYPELVRNNKNIKLKIQSGMSPQSSSVPSTVELDKDGKNQKVVQYVFLKSDFASVKKEDKPPEGMGAENRSGPWFCIPCKTDDGPLIFETYYNYRKHLQGVHNEKIDARICEHCGFKASKRNLHLYHLYTKHNIAPPRNINFPKCDQCNYIALSENLLMKHRSNHTGIYHNKEFTCRLCSATFKSYGALNGHMQTNLHFTDQAAKKDYECEFCGKIFNRNINLKAHIRTSHQDESRKTYDDEDRVDDTPGEQPKQVEPSNQEVMEVIEVPVFDSIPEGNKALYLPPGMTILAESPAVPLLPSSESEAMNNVATGIATSINITDRNISDNVIVLDGNSEIILRGAPTYVLNQDGSYSVQEYIVPDMINETGQVYTALVSTAPATGISYVSSDNISIITSGSDHTYADGMKINGHVTATPQGPTVITSQVQVSQASQPIIVQEPIIVNTDWVQSIATSQPQEHTVKITSGSSVDSAAQTSQSEESPSMEKTAQTLVSDWGDLEDDTHDNSDDDESEIKPSRPTIELNVCPDM